MSNRLDKAVEDLRETQSSLTEGLQKLRELVPEEVDPERRAAGESLIDLTASWLETAEALVGPPQKEDA